MSGIDVVSISCSRKSVVAITKDGQAFTWGEHDEKHDKIFDSNKHHHKPIFNLVACTDNGAILTSSRRKQCFVMGGLSSFQSLESSEESKERQTKIRLLWVEIGILSSYRDMLRREYADAELEKDTDETLQRVLHRRIELLRGTFISLCVIFLYSFTRSNNTHTHRHHSITSQGSIGR